MCRLSALAGWLATTNSIDCAERCGGPEGLAVEIVHKRRPCCKVAQLD